MSKLDFTRSNVAESTLNVTQPNRSSFDLYHRKDCTLPIGRFLPVNVECVMPNSVLAGAITPEFSLDTIVTPNIGPLRLDTHTIAVSARRINSDWRKLIEGKYDVIPTCNVPQVFSRLLFHLTHKQASDYMNSDGRWDSDQFYEDVRQFYFELASDVNNNFGYLRDFAMSEYTRLGNYEPTPNCTTAKFAPILHAVVEPYFGEGSVLDMLKYPIFGYFSSNMQMLLDIDYNIPQAFTTWNQLFSISQVLDPDSGVLSLKFEYATNNLNEMLIRAQYAAWYDTLRNWHVEERAYLPDPDNWTGSSILVPGIEYYVLTCLLVPRYRCFGSDPFTSVQTDDIYRHVFSPLYNDKSSNDGYDFNSVGSKDENAIMNSIYQVLIDGVSSIFPQGFFRRQTGSSISKDQYMLDLNTMKRAGMLERFLARNYFFPDTYEGQMRARWGIDASDLLGCTSRYISGSESFVTGQQQIASTGTDGVNGTPAGTRTFTGGASSSEKISFSTGGDFIYLVTFASLQPIPTYDSLDMHLAEVSRADLPFPEFADDTRVQIKASDMIRGHVDQGHYLGYVPRYYQYRTCMDSVHGKFLRDYRSQIWLRDWFSTVSNGRAVIAGSPFAITAYGLHVHVPMDAFLGGLGEWSHVAYGNIKFNLAVDCPLPAAIETV